MTEFFDTPESLEPINAIGSLVCRCGFLVTQIARHRLDSQHISFTQWLALSWLAERPHASPTELSAHLEYDTGALTRMIDKLERTGMVSRHRCQHDRRVVQIAITPEGRRLARAGRRIMVELQNELVAPYSKREVDTFIALLQRCLLSQTLRPVSQRPAIPLPSTTK
jgi:DNA-binding MarR family transcriptional regulator